MLGSFFVCFQYRRTAAAQYPVFSALEIPADRTNDESRARFQTSSLEAHSTLVRAPSLVLPRSQTEGARQGPVFPLGPCLFLIAQHTWMLGYRAEVLLSGGKAQFSSTPSGDNYAEEEWSGAVYCGSVVGQVCGGRTKIEEAQSKISDLIRRCP